METKLRAVFGAGHAGGNVAGLCRELGISRDSYYRLKKRWEAEGPPGLVARSRRPHRSPAMIAADLEDEIVRLRKTLPVDNGAQTIAYHLARSGWPVPSVATIHRALVRRGLVVAQPEKRPKAAAWRRFEWPAPNAAWQIDATCWALADGAEVWIMDVLDDHSRVAVAARVCATASGAAAWDAFCAGSAAWGLPQHVMSDNGTCFTGRFLSGGEVAFERNLRALGVRHLLSSPAHPQTCGKLERFHQTLKRWLALRPLASTHTELQAQLDEFVDHYNNHRPHRALAGATPAERWHASPPAQPGDPIQTPPSAALHRVSNTGMISWKRHTIGVGTEHAGTRLLIVARDDDIAIFNACGLVRRLTLDPTRAYQPTGRPRGGPKRRP